MVRQASPSPRSYYDDAPPPQGRQGGWPRHQMAMPILPPRALFFLRGPRALFELAFNITHHLCVAGHESSLFSIPEIFFKIVRTNFTPDGPKYCRENSLFNTILNFVFLFDTEKLFLPYLTTFLNFMPFITLSSILSRNDT